MDGDANRSLASSSSAREDDATNVLSLLSFAIDDGPIIAMSDNTSSGRRGTHLQRPVASMQGVLWKRRDVFRNRWRPRWFVLHPQQGILTYYLLNGNSQPTSTTMTPTSNNTGMMPSNRRRADSDISMDTIDYEVVPRGSIFLGNATVYANESLTRPEERLYALTISDQESGTSCHLASRTSTGRDRWQEKIQEVITQQQIRTSQRSSATTTTTNLEEEVAVSSSQTGTDPQQQEVVTTIEEHSDDLPLPREAPVVQSKAKWVTVASPDLTSGVPPSILSKLESVLDKNLPYVSDEHHPDLKFAYEEEGVEVANHKSLPLFRSIYKVPDRHPAEYLGLIWNVSSAPELLEPNIRTQETLRVLNKNTSLVYTAYQPVWPTTARDFCSVAHWRLVQNIHATDEVALCLVAFSCPEANQLKPIDRHHVRGTLNVSMHFWRPVVGGGCIHTRILSLDMNGKIPKQLIQTIMHQQATFTPRAMEVQLKKIRQENKRNTVASSAQPPRMDYEYMLQVIAETKKSHHKKPELRHLQSKVVSTSSDTFGEIHNFETPQSVSIGIESLVLLLPLALQQLVMTVVVPPQVEVTFVCAAMLLCLRWVLLRHLLCYCRILPTTAIPKRTAGGTTTIVCRLSMSIQTTLMFLENERQAKTALGEEDLATLELHHVILRSISKALQKYPILAARSFSFLPPLYNFDAQWHEVSNSNNEAPLWIPSHVQHSIQSIADFSDDMSPKGPTKHHHEDSFWLPKLLLGPSFQVWAAERVFGQEGSTIASRVVETPPTCPISVFLHSAACAKETNDKLEPGDPQDSPSASSTALDLMFIFNNNYNADKSLCESFVKEVEKLLHCPELCDA